MDYNTEPDVLLLLHWFGAGFLQRVDGGRGNGFLSVKRFRPTSKLCRLKVDGHHLGGRHLRHGGVPVAKDGVGHHQGDRGGGGVGGGEGGGRVVRVIVG